MSLQLFATTPKGLELLLVEELKSLGATDPAEKLAGVSFSGDLSLAYKACLWSRLANRILLTLQKVPAATPEALYAGVKSIDWSQHMEADGCLSVHFVSSQSQITHTLFGAQTVKDAIVDQFREKFGTRPSVSKEAPDIHVYVYLYRDYATISLDLSGQSLHKRGYRIANGQAPLKENLAAAILMRAAWPAIAKAGGSLLDPMCGSGTLLIEAALMAADIAPGLERQYYGFWAWKQHEPAIWDKLVAEAEERKEQGYKQIPSIIGYDQDAIAVKNTFANIERAGMKGYIHVEKRELNEFAPPSKAKPGLVVTNPPYGERLGEIHALQPLYTEIGNRLKAGLTGWQAAVFTGNPDLGKVMGLRAKRRYALFNGAIPCQLLLFDVQPEYFIDRSPEAENERRIRAAKKAVVDSDTTAITMFMNRLNKNLKHLMRQVKRDHLSAYTVYDADLPEYAFLIEIADGKVQVTEYQAPKTINKQVALHRQQQVLAVLPELLDIAPRQIFFQIRYKD